MALPESGLISLSDLQAQFGGSSSPISLADYYGSGSLVITGTTGRPGGVRQAIPSSGALSLQDFHGAPAEPILTGVKTHLLASAPNSAGPAYNTTIQTARFTVNASGEVVLTATGTNVDADGCSTMRFYKNGALISSYGFCTGTNVRDTVVAVDIGDVLTITLQETDPDASHAISNQGVWAGENHVGCITVG